MRSQRYDTSGHLRFRKDGGVNVGSLFSGIGGFDLGLERAGFRTSWFCEQDEFCQRVLAKHWPGIPCHGDIRELTAADVSPVDVLCGGFPCQDLSSAGKRAGLGGARSGLWFEYLRLIGELRPRYVIVENVPQLRKYLDTITGGLAEIGYDAEWDVISAKDFGAPHLRRRIWLVAYPQREQLREQSGRRGWEGGAGPSLVAVDGEARPLAEWQRTWSRGEQGAGAFNWWITEPDVGRVAHGIPARVDRLRSLGNALVPQIAEWIGHRIMSYEESR